MIKPITTASYGGYLQHEADTLVVGITGASGAILGLKTLEALVAYTPLQLAVVYTQAADLVFSHELPHSSRPQHARITYYAPDNLLAPIASGSYPTRGMVVVPCSMSTVAHIAHGLADNLLCRAADVTLKEQRPLLLAPRESPLSRVHLENLLLLSRVGVMVVPPMPTFYTQLTTIEEMAWDFALHLVELLGYGVPRYRWGVED